MQSALQIQVTDLAHVIQLAVAPVFLLTGVGSILSVLTMRVGRIVDRTRQLEHQLAGSETLTYAVVRSELGILARRVRLANWSIRLCTIGALLICTVIVSLFVGAFIGLDFSAFIALLFILAMIALILALILFLKEIILATASLHIGQR